MVSFASVLVDCGGGLGAEVPDLGIEVESADAVRTMRTGELHATLDPLNFIGFHCTNCSP